LASVFKGDFRSPGVCLWHEHLQDRNTARENIPGVGARNDLAIKASGDVAEAGVEDIGGGWVAAITMTLVFVSNPSISTRIWFSVGFTLIMGAAQPCRHAGRPTAVQFHRRRQCKGCLRFGLPSKRGRERGLCSLRAPQNISTNSEAADAKERYSRFTRDGAGDEGSYPYQEDQTRSRPFGMAGAPQTQQIFRGYFQKNSTISCSSCLASLLTSRDQIGQR